MCKSAADAAADSSDEDEVTVFECVLLFLHNIMRSRVSLRHSEVGKLDATLLDILEVMSRLRSQLNLRRADRFYGHKTKQATRKLSATEQSKFATLIDCFFEKAILYLEANFDFDDPVLSHTSCLCLSGPLEWDALEGLVNKLALDIDEDKLYQDYTVLNSVFEFIPENLAPDKKWVFSFKKAQTATELLKVVSFVFSVPNRVAAADQGVHPVQQSQEHQCQDDKWNRVAAADQGVHPVQQSQEHQCQDDTWCVDLAAGVK
ncbi:unnamed protein product [Boreogadus saida]